LDWSACFSSNAGEPKTFAPASTSFAECFLLYGPPN
jgi:hypothetical protein